MRASAWTRCKTGLTVHAPCRRPAQEIDALLDLDHPNVVGLKEYFVDQNKASRVWRRRATSWQRFSRYTPWVAALPQGGEEQALT